MCLSKLCELFDRFYSLFERDHSERFLKARLRRHMRPPGLEFEAYVLAAMCIFCLVFLVYVDDRTLLGYRIPRNDTISA
ncbi:hypothetical protein HNY73_022765 [Argiope bruennichi]|uniref:Uncharacterized protein n=1 Tax=Argiope bruennichi TaxID=94029 RepID=A0A8T0E3F7_ARGBR|nr:hypothetical protein HNY73_022765 [Argiope bruennichi]